MTRLSWTQPICEACWRTRELRRPVRLLIPQRETCAFCGNDTYDGIFVRADPATVPWPRQEPD